MSEPQETDPEAEERSHAETETEEEPQVPEAAPTDFRGNLWVLLTILGVVLLAWAVSLLSSTARGEESAGEAEEAPAEDETGRSGAVFQNPISPLVVVGGGQTFIPASPSRTGRTVEGRIRPARLFNVSRRVPDFDPGRLFRPAGHWADRRPVLSVVEQPPSAFASGSQVTGMLPNDRVAVVSAGGSTRAYPVLVLQQLAGIRDRLGERYIFVCWSRFTQLASCLSAGPGREPLKLRDAGILHRGNPLLYDAPRGSLWEPLGGRALTGPLAGTRAEVLPVGVWPWREWIARNPDAPVLRPGALPGQPDFDRLRALQRNYLSGDGAPFPVPGYDSSNTPLPARSFVLGIASGGEAAAYPLRRAWQNGQTDFTDTVGGRQYGIRVTSPRTAHAVSDGEPATASVMLWFGWVESHPRTRLGPSGR